MASAAYMPAQLRAYITPEEYESAFAMSNKLQKQYWRLENNQSLCCMFSCGACLPCFCFSKCFCQISQHRIGEPFKQWEKNGLKVVFTLGRQGGNNNKSGTANVVRVHFPTS